MKWTGLLVCVVFCAIVCVQSNPAKRGSKKEPADKGWWKNATFYQIYPRSFKDSDGDGVGDLKGITEKLEYLKKTGITATWLSPIFKSPMNDFGYDISNFREIDPTFGTMEDFDKLLAKAKELDIKIILDFVPNHASNESEWFLKSVAKHETYGDYFIWSDGVVSEDGKKGPPNNWISVFGGSAWEYVSERDQYYLHQFTIGQPDLNYRNENVVREMKDIMKFWLDRGVAGFRVDAVPFLFEVEDLADEAESGDGSNENQHGYLIHNLTQNLDETFDMIYQWREVLDKYDDFERIMMTEAYADIENTMRYYGNETHDGAHFTFNFLLITDLNKDSSAEDFVNTINKWTEYMPEKYTENWVLGNHDNHRVATRYGTDRIDALNMLIMTLPGVGVTYNGEEIGMEDGKVTYEETVDPPGVNAGPEEYEKYSRDPERTPFHWDNTTNAGFSTSKKTWLPVSEKYIENNLMLQEGEDNSHYEIYKKILEIRANSDVLQARNNTKVESKEDVLIVTRHHEKENSLVYVFNVGAKDSSVDLTTILDSEPSSGKILVKSQNAKHSTGDTLNFGKIELKPGEAYLVEASGAGIFTSCVFLIIASVVMSLSRAV